MSDDSGASERRPAGPPKRRRWPRRHPVIVVLLSIVALLLATILGWGFYLNSQLSGIPQVDIDADVDREGRPPQRGGGFSVLLVGVDNPEGPGIQEAVENETWVPDVYRSDAIMVLHVDTDGRAAQLVSIPRGSYVKAPGHGQIRLNFAMSLGGPGLLVRTVEDLLDHRLNHVAVIDIAGFAALTEDFGGVELELERPLQVPETGEVIEPGVRTLGGDELLPYVRERRTLPRGDLDRVRRQQAVMRSIAGQVLQPETLRNPLKITNLTQTVTRHLVTDDKLTSSEIRSLAWRSRDLRTSSIRFVTVPYGNKARLKVSGDGQDRRDPVGRSILLLNADELREMFDLIEEDEFEAWLAENGDEANLLSGGATQGTAVQ